MGGYTPGGEVYRGGEEKVVSLEGRTTSVITIPKFPAFHRTGAGRSPI